MVRAGNWRLYMRIWLYRRLHMRVWLYRRLSWVLEMCGCTGGCTGGYHGYWKCVAVQEVVQEAIMGIRRAGNVWLYRYRRGWRFDIVMSSPRLTLVSITRLGYRPR